MRVLVTGTRGLHRLAARPRTCSSAATTWSASTPGFYRSGWLYDATPVDRRDAEPATSASSTPGDLEGCRRRRAHGRALERPARAARARRHATRSTTAARCTSPRRAKAAGVDALRLHVVVQRLRRGDAGPRRRGVAAQPADGVRRVQGARRARRRRDGRRRLLADVPAQRDRVRRLAADALRHRPQQPLRASPGRRRRSGWRATARRGGRSCTCSTSARRSRCALEAPRERVHDQILNVGDPARNYQIREIAEIVGARLPGLPGDRRRSRGARHPQLPRRRSTRSTRCSRSSAATGTPSAARGSCSTSSRASG